MTLKLLAFLALVLTALALVPAGAHLFALPNKIGLTQEAYFTVQNIYRGWSLFGIVLIGAILADFGFALAARLRHSAAAPWALASLLLMVADLAVFFLWTYPANQATSNWTAAPENWEALREQWEYAHAAGALLTFLALCALFIGVLVRDPDMSI